MKDFINNIKADKLTFRGFIISFLVGIFTLLVVIVVFKSLPPFIPIFNQLPWGEQRLTETVGIFIPLVVFAFIFVFNLSFTSLVYSKNPLIARIVAAVTLIIAIMNFVFIAKTIFTIL
jgi:hypothetical protein